MQRRVGSLKNNHKLYVSDMEAPGGKSGNV